MSTAEIQTAAEEQGLRVSQIATGLYSIRGTWEPVMLSTNHGEIEVRCSQRKNRVRRWKQIYKGNDLGRAMAAAAEWKE